MSDANTPQQQESVSRTFYVLRNTTWGRGEFTKTLKSGGPSSLSSHTVDDATPYYTLADAVAAQKTAVALGFGSYEIVMVSRSVTKGVLKSPAKTVRRVVDEQEALQRGALWALANPYSRVVPGNGAGISWVTKDGNTAGSHTFSDTPLFVSLKKLVEFVAEYPSLFANHGVNIARVVEETVPEVRTEDVVKDILTPLP